MQRFSLSPKEMFASFWRNRGLILALTKREIAGRYRGSFIGMLWALINPLLMLAVYTFVFGMVFQSRWNVATNSKTEFALVLFVGLLVYNLFAECVNRAPGLILANVNYVKKVVFPLEILPWVALGTALFHMLVSLLVWLVFYVLLFGMPHGTGLLLPVMLLPFILLIMGITWWLSSLGVYLRDVSQVIAVVTMALMFLAPIFYPPTSIPARYQHLLSLNPVTTPISEARDLLFWGKLPDITTYGLYLLCSAVIAWLGFAWFQKTRKGFADVI